MPNLLTYLVARQGAHNLDRQGVRPPLVLRVLVYGTAYAMLAFVLVVAGIALYAIATHA